MLAATPHKAPTIRPPASHHKNYPRQTNQTCRTLLEKQDVLISDVLLWTPTYGRAKAGRLGRTYIQQLCEDTECSREDLPEAMNDREKWRERSGISVPGAKYGLNSFVIFFVCTFFAVRILRDRSSSNRGSYPLCLVVLWYLVRRHVMHCFNVCD